MALTRCYTCMKYLVVIFNFMFWLVGIAVLAVSIWLYLDSSNYIQNKDDSYMYFLGVFILMAAGAIMLLIGILGCCGALRESLCMQTTFFVLLLVVFVAVLTGGVWAYLHIDEGNRIIDIEVTKMVKNEYGLSKSADGIIDAMQRDLKCCGAKKPSDWAHSRLNSKGNNAPDVGVSESSGFYTVPASCCKMQNTEDCEFHRKVKFAGHLFEGLHSEGCVYKLQRYFQDLMFIVVIIGIGVAVIQLFGLILSMTLCCFIRNQNALANA